MAFLLMLCITGLPLIFKEEIDDVLAPHPELSEIESTSRASLDEIIATDKAARPNSVIQYVFFMPGEPVVGVGSGPSLDATPEQVENHLYDLRTGKPLDGGPLAGSALMAFILQLHKDMFAGLAGMLFLGLMGLLMVISTVSGIVLYAPYMRRLDFGTIRHERRTRVKWLDMHNFIGIATMVWVGVVALTGVINTLATPIISLWQMGQLAEMTAAYRNAPPLTKIGSLDTALEIAQRATPGMEPHSIVFPGTMFTSQHHYGVYMRGTDPLTSRLLKPVLIEAERLELTDVRDMPLYVSAFLLSQPLHFGDYGGMPLKIIWALFTVLTIVVLASGFYLWLARGKAREEEVLQKIARAHATAAASRLANA